MLGVETLLLIHFIGVAIGGGGGAIVVMGVGAVGGIVLRKEGTMYIVV